MTECADEGFACEYDPVTGICPTCGSDLKSSDALPQDDLFAAITAGVEIEEPEPATDLTELPLERLLFLQAKILDDLTERGALLHPQTDEDRDLQTRYYGVMMELRRRQGGHV